MLEPSFGPLVLLWRTFAIHRHGTSVLRLKSYSTTLSKENHHPYKLCVVTVLQMNKLKKTIALDRDLYEWAIQQIKTKRYSLLSKPSLNLAMLKLLGVCGVWLF